jgi:hypothetical protein
MCLSHLCCDPFNEILGNELIEPSVGGLERNAVFLAVPTKTEKG